MSFYASEWKLTELKRLARFCFPSGPTSTLAPPGRRGTAVPWLRGGSDGPRPAQRGPAPRSPGSGLLPPRAREAEAGARPGGQL